MIYLVIDTEAKKIAGVVQLKDIDFNAGKREFGYFVDRDYVNKGIATKSIAAAARFCFDTLNLNKVFMRIAEENTASRRVAESTMGSGKRGSRTGGAGDGRDRGAQPRLAR